MSKHIYSAGSLRAALRAGSLAARVAETGATGIVSPASGRLEVLAPASEVVDPGCIIAEVHA